MDNRRFCLPVGILTLATAFSVLCLAILAALAASAANQAERLAQTSAQAAAAYYAADAAACETADAFRTLWAENAEEETWDIRAQELNAQTAWTEDGMRVSFTVPIDAARQLSVELLAGGTFSVLRWQTVSTSDWAPDDAIDVWDGTALPG